MHVRLWQSFFLVFAMSLLLVACRTKNYEQKKLTDIAPNKLKKDLGLALIDANEVVRRGVVHAIRLDENDFRVNGLRVSEKTFLSYETPIVFFEMPKEADYVEIIRCPADVIIHGGADTIDYVELGSRDLQTETRIYQRNNFWEAAAMTSGCINIASSYTDTSFEDVLAPTGSFHYYLRACVDEQRLIGARSLASATCSRQVSRSSEHRHANKRGKLELQALQNAVKIRSKIDALNRDILAKTILLNQQLLDCQQRHDKMVVTKEKQAAIQHILAASVAFGLPVLGSVGYLARQKNWLAPKAAKLTSASGASWLAKGASGVSIVGLSAAAGLLVAAVYAAANETAPGFPEDSKHCYDKAALRQLAEQGASTSEDPATQKNLLCSCAEALATQAALAPLAVDLGQQLKRQETSMANAELASQKEAKK